MSKSSFHAACRLAVGVLLLALVTHTWLVMGLVVPVTVAGSSMAPTLHGSQRVFRCDQCQLEFAVDVEPNLGEPIALCPHCGRTSTRSVADLHGDRLLVDRMAFTLGVPRRWEVVVFRSPQNAGQLCVKRLAGLPGETVTIVDGDVLINGARAPNPCGVQYVIRYGDTANGREGWRLGPDEYYVLGDNADISDDSRSWVAGPGVDAKLLIGRPLGVR